MGTKNHTVKKYKKNMYACVLCIIYIYVMCGHNQVTIKSCYKIVLPRRSKQPLVPQDLGICDPRPLHMRVRPLHMKAHERLGRP